jgi:intracellular septation protein
MTNTPAAAPRARKALNPWLKFTLELGPLALFFVTYKIWDYLPATVVLMASVALTLCVSYRVLGRIPTMPLVTAVIVGIFGGLTVLFQDKTLLQMKPTALYLLFGGALFVGLAIKKPLLKIMFDEALHVTEEGWRKLTWRWAFFFLALAALNECVRHYCNDGVGQSCTFDTWVKFKTFGFLPLTLVFALAQAPLILRHEAKGEETGEDF